MLSKIVMGRLGNQMFQYATMRAIQEKYYPDEKINLVFSEIERNGKAEDGFFNQLGIFDLDKSKFVVDQKTKLTIVQKVLFVKYFVIRKIIKITSKKTIYEQKKRKYEQKIQKKYNKKGLFLFSYGYCDFEKTEVKNKMFLGFFESSRFFDGIRNIVLKEFTPKEAPLKKNNELYKKIAHGESVCVSVRRGDFTSERFKDSAYVCTPEYFEKAIKLAMKKIKNAKFVVFSDDIEWVKKNMHFPEGAIYEDGNDPVWEKLRLMYSCKHFIISNSTFSWWAQYLSRNESKIVIAPSVWRKIGYNGRDLYDDKWELIEV